MIPMRAPTLEEVKELETYLADAAEFLAGAGVGVTDKYITDGPGYYGKVICVVWPGAPETISSFIWIDGRLQQCQ